jgi:hypothetical protein
MVRSLIVILIVLCFASMATAENIPAPLIGDGAPAPGYTAPTPSQAYALQTNAGCTVKVPVQRVAQLRSLEWWEIAAIDKYMCDHPKLGASFRAYPEFLIRIDQSHVEKVYDMQGRLVGGRLNRTPHDYAADYQTFTQLYNRTDWYVNIPSQKTTLCLPDYCPPGSQGALCFEPLTTPCQPVTGCTATYCPTGGAARFYHEGRVDEHVVATYFQSKTKAKVEQRRYRPPCPPPPPPPPPPCPPGGPPPEQNPSGCNVLPTDGGSNHGVPPISPPPGVRR